MPKSFGNTPQAVDDAFSFTEDALSIVFLDVMANDKGGNAKTLYSLDNGVSGGGSPSDLLVKDSVLSTDTSFYGAKIWITTDGKVGYDFGSLPSAFKAQLDALSVGEFIEDRFTYAIQLGNGALSWATATVKLTGVNDPPVASPATGSGHENGGPIVVELSATDADSDFLFFSITSEPGHGTLFTSSGDPYQLGDILTDRKIVFVPEPDFDGQVTFGYKVMDDGGATDTSTITITVSPPALLAVAFTNDDGVAGYNANTDNLIAALLDTNNDGVVSVGDSVQWGTYPVNFTGDVRGPLTGLGDPVTAFSTSSGDIVVDVSNGTVRWSTNSEFDLFLVGADVLTDFHPTGGIEFSDSISLSGLVLSSLSPTNDAFLDVLIF